MNVANAFFCFLLLAVFIAEAALLCRVLPLQRRLTAEDLASGRLLTVDGLRGILAPSVFIHHALLFFFLLQTGHWEEAPSNFYAQMGVLPVTLFFFVTGYLFWSKLMKRPDLGFIAFMKDRLGRLGGAYLLACLLLFLFVAVASGFHRQQSWGRLILDVVKWFSFLGAGHDINGVFDSKRLLGQVWTLRLEWMFYLSLPFFGWFARRRWRLPLLLAGALLLSLLADRVTFGFNWPVNYAWKTLGGYAQFLFETFSAGMIVAAVKLSKPARAWAQGHSAAVLSVGLLAITAWAVPARYGWLESGMLIVPFACICSGNTLFGLLASAPVRSLGRISYSFYLLHVFVLQAGVAVLARFTSVGSLSALSYWSFVAVCGVLAVLVSYLSYQFLEHPFMKKAVKPVAEKEPLKPAAAIWETPLWF